MSAQERPEAVVGKAPLWVDENDARLLSVALEAVTDLLERERELAEATGLANERHDRLRHLHKLRSRVVTLLDEFTAATGGGS